jgi:hypothetical protein
MIKDRKTDTTIFLMPVLGIDRNKLEQHNFIDAFLDDVSKQPHYDNCIYILFKPENLEYFQEFLELEKERYNEIVDDYDYSGGYVVVVYKFPEEFTEDMQLVLNGKYSQTSEAFKSKFLKIKKIVTESGLRQDLISLQWLVFRKSNDIVQSWEEEYGITIEEGQEVWGIPDMDREILDIEKIRNNEQGNIS